MFRHSPCLARRLGSRLAIFSGPSWLIVLLATVLQGCASFSNDGGMAEVKGLAAERMPFEVAAFRGDEDAAEARPRIDALLKRPLTADAAVQVALLNNRDLQATYNALGMAEARRVRASLPPNPTFSLSHISGGGGFEIERQAAISILALATLPARAGIADDRFYQAQLQATAETLRVATETRRAWVEAVAERAVVIFLAQAQESASTTSELSKRLNETGAINKLEQARNQVFYAEITAQLSTAKRRAEAARERLIRLMGLSGNDLAFRLPRELPPLPRKPRASANIEVDAVAHRLDLQIARIELEALAKSYGLTNATRFVSLLNVAGISKHLQEPGGDPVTETGFGAELQIPVFDFGETNVREAEQAYRQAFNRLSAKATNVRSEAREAYQGYRIAYDIAQRYQREVLPLRKLISDEMLLRYNAMQVDVFALLVDARARIQSTIAAIDANRDFRLAEAALAATIVGGTTMPPTEASGAVAALAPDASH